MHQEALERVAHAGALELAVLHEGEGHVDVGALVDEEVADALVVLDDGHARVLGDESGSAPRRRGDDEIDLARHADEELRLFAAERRDDLHRVGGETDRGDGLAHQLAQGRVGSRRLFSAAQGTALPLLRHSAAASTVTLGRAS